MKTLAIINFGNTPEDKLSDFGIRNAARAVIFDKDGKIALMHSTVDKFHKIPGGGLEGDENKETALRRECLEEAGVEVGNLIELGFVKEIKGDDKMVQNSYCYVTKVVGEKKSPNFTESEIAQGFEVIWVGLDEAYNLVKNDGYSNSLGRYIQARELNILTEAKKFDQTKL
jgi:ADP-ribose pyrophosphatase YjhB (NUDIX family)